MTESAYPQYVTRNGVPYTAYVVDAIGREMLVDGGAYRGTHGTIGSYTTAEEAIEAARRAKDETCTVQVIDTRADDAPRIIFSL